MGSSQASFWLLSLLAVGTTASSSSSSAPVTAPSTTAFLAVSSTVYAGAPSTATIAAGTFRGSGDTKSVRALELFLAIGDSDAVKLSSNATVSECYLTQDTPLCNIEGITVYSDHIAFSDVQLPFTIPPSVGGEGLLYALRVQILQADGTVFGSGASSSSLPPSNAFFLTNVTGRSELFETVYAPAGYVPCGSLSCVNDCFVDLFGTTANLTSESETTATCANKCADIGEDVPSDWLELASSSLPVLSTVPAGTATGCFVSGTGTATAGVTTTTGATKSSAKGVRGLLSWPWTVTIALGACLVLMI
ncbi:hypothetical protein SEUCBS140593_009373 [Sporothrix eucalyptigena]|uniref:Uncharacterized protein n=1 Tax=Sporothrix eucalyptigena TaxID=1812306 RepID=A0ABP0CXR6_9PEZI